MMALSSPSPPPKPIPSNYITDSRGWVPSLSPFSVQLLCYCRTCGPSTSAACGAHQSLIRTIYLGGLVINSPAHIAKMRRVLVVFTFLCIYFQQREIAMIHSRRLFMAVQGDMCPSKTSLDEWL